MCQENETKDEVWREYEQNIYFYKLRGGTHWKGDGGEIDEVLENLKAGELQQDVKEM